MASLSRPQLADFYTQKAACNKEGSSSNMQSLYSLMHILHPKYPHAGAAASPHHEYNMSAAKPFYYGSNIGHGMSNNGRSVGEDVEEPSFLGTRATVSTVTSRPSLDDQVSSLHHPHEQVAATDARSSTPLSSLGGELHVTAAKKRIRAAMECKEVPDKNSDAKKRIKTSTCEAHPRRSTEAPTIQRKATMINNAEKMKASCPLKRSMSNTEQKSADTKSNVTKASSLTLDDESPTKPDYIHVRARRGQATDSHSLAERVRREKISERMKYLQDLVPSCIKVTGKAMMLDEIINYVQSLQRQVEFLSMKLAAVPPSRLEYSFDTLFGKKAVEPSNVNGANTNTLHSDAAVMQAAFAPPTTYPSNAQMSFVNTISSSEIFPDQSVQSTYDVNSSMQLQTSHLHDLQSMACSPADAFFANLPSDLAVDDALLHHSSAGSTNCSLVTSPTDHAVFDPAQQSSISQSSQMQLEWDDDLQNIVQQMGCFTQANSSWLPTDHLLTEGFFLQGNIKDEL